MRLPRLLCAPGRFECDGGGTLREELGGPQPQCRRPCVGSGRLVAEVARHDGEVFVEGWRGGVEPCARFERLARLGHPPGAVKRGAQTNVCGAVAARVYEREGERVRMARLLVGALCEALVTFLDEGCKA